MQMVKITNSVFETSPNGLGVSEEKFKAGGLYPVTEDTQRQVGLRNGELVEVEDPAPEAAAAEAAAPAAPKGKAKA